MAAIERKSPKNKTFLRDISMEEILKIKILK